MVNALEPQPHTAEAGEWKDRSEEIFDIEAFRAASLVADPYPHLELRRFIRPEALQAINASYPPIERAAAYDLDDFTLSSAVAGLVAELSSDKFARAIGNKFD